MVGVGVIVGVGVWVGVTVGVGVVVGVGVGVGVTQIRVADVPAMHWPAQQTNPGAQGVPWGALAHDTQNPFRQLELWAVHGLQVAPVVPQVYWLWDEYGIHTLPLQQPFGQLWLLQVMQVPFKQVAPCEQAAQVLPLLPQAPAF